MRKNAADYYRALPFSSLPASQSSKKLIAEEPRHESSIVERHARGRKVAGRSNSLGKLCTINDRDKRPSSIGSDVTVPSKVCSHYMQSYSEE